MPGPDDVSGVILITLQALNHCRRYVVCCFPVTLPGACRVIIIIVANITTTTITTVALHNIQRSVDSW